MKKTLVITLAAFVAVSSVSAQTAAPSPANPPAQGGKSEPGKEQAGKGKKMFDKLKADLTLTDDQAQKVQAILLDQRKATEGLRGDTSLTKEQKQEKTKAARAEMESKINALLTPEQKAKWEQVKKDRPKKDGKKAAN